MFFSISYIYAGCRIAQRRRRDDEMASSQRDARATRTPNPEHRRCAEHAARPVENTHISGGLCFCCRVCVWSV